MICPKCGDKLRPTISYMAPIYETTICFKCGGLFYELKDKSQLEAITNKAREEWAKTGEGTERVKKLLGSIGTD